MDPLTVATRHSTAVVDLDTLRPRARALALACAANRWRAKGLRIRHATTGETREWAGATDYPIRFADDVAGWLEANSLRVPLGWALLIQDERPAREWDEAPTADQELTRAEVREVLDAGGVAMLPSTWSAYVSRGQAPEPVRTIGRTPLWSMDAVIQWATTRPGPGARTDLPQS